jgi:hypothetical protein
VGIVRAVRRVLEARRAHQRTPLAEATTA